MLRPRFPVPASKTKPTHMIMKSAIIMTVVNRHQPVIQINLLINYVLKKVYPRFKHLVVERKNTTTAKTETEKEPAKETDTEIRLIGNRLIDTP